MLQHAGTTVACKQQGKGMGGMVCGRKRGQGGGVLPPCAVRLSLLRDGKFECDAGTHCMYIFSSPESTAEPRSGGSECAKSGSVAWK